MEHAAAGYQSNYSTIRFFKIVPITLRTSFIIILMKLATELEVSLREFISAGAAEVCESGGPPHAVVQAFLGSAWFGR
jgi:hypothetical protein